MVTVPRPATGLVDRERLFALLDRGVAGRVTLVCAPAGSGKSTLVSSWLRGAQLPGPAVWIAVERDESDATRFWATVMDALRDSGAIAPGDPLATVAPAPLGGHDELLRGLLEGLERLGEPLVVVLEDLHHLRSNDALAGLETVVTKAPEQLRTVLVSRRDPKLGLHRLRLAGELTEIRSADLDFTPEEAGELLAGAGVAVGEDDVARLHRRTEGWAAGLRLAALSLSRHEAPERFVAEFSGSERTVADYLLGEVLASEPPEVRELLLRTCILEQVTGPLADVLTGRDDSARLLHHLEDANALVVAVDVGRTWFRYHHLLADLLRLELRREAPGEVAALHRAAATWLAENGHPIDSIRHAGLSGDGELAAELLGRHWVQLILDGEEATLAALLEGLPPGLVDTDGEVATIAAADLLAESRWPEADARLAAAQTTLGELPEGRRRRAEAALATAQLFRARRLGDLGSVVDGAAGILAGDGAPVRPELRALALMNLGIAEAWTLRLADAETHLERGLALGRRIGSPYIEVACLSALGVVCLMSHRPTRAEELFRQAIATADRVGWPTHPLVGVSYMNLAQSLIDRGGIAEGEEWLVRSEPILAGGAEPAAKVAVRFCRGTLETYRGRHADALAAFRDAERLADELRAPFFLGLVARQWQLRAQLRLGEVEPVRAAIAAAREAGMAGAALWCSLQARVCLLDDDPAGAVAAVAPVLAGEAFALHINQEIEGFVLDALARTRLGEHDAARESVESALERAEREGRVWIVVTVPGARELLESHPVHRTAHPEHLKTLLAHLAGAEPPRAGQAPAAPSEPLSERELGVLRFLPTNLSAAEIGSELFLSVHTVKTHMRKLYAKLDVHTRAEAVQCARALGLLAPAQRLG
jgi:LuxR family maltose regulon positive regulatory protein